MDSTRLGVLEGSTGTTYCVPQMFSLKSSEGEERREEPKRLYDVMVDLETLSTHPDAAIITIGAIKFDRYGPLPPLESMDIFYRRIDLTSCETLGMHFSAETIFWWMQQHEEVRAEEFHPEARIPIRPVLKEFSLWFGNSTYFWSQGDAFDGVILKEAYRKCHLTEPWKFWNQRDTRTLFDVAGIRKEDLPETLLHHAVYDCYRQIAGVLKALQKIGFH